MKNIILELPFIKFIQIPIVFTLTVFTPLMEGASIIWVLPIYFLTFPVWQIIHPLACIYELMLMQLTPAICSVFVDLPYKISTVFFYENRMRALRCSVFKATFVHSSIVIDDDPLPVRKPIFPLAIVVSRVME